MAILQHVTRGNFPDDLRGLVLQVIERRWMGANSWDDIQTCIAHQFSLRITYDSAGVGDGDERRALEPPVSWRWPVPFLIWDKSAKSESLSARLLRDIFWGQRVDQRRWLRI